MGERGGTRLLRIRKSPPAARRKRRGFDRHVSRTAVVGVPRGATRREYKNQHRLKTTQRTAIRWSRAGRDQDGNPTCNETRLSLALETVSACARSKDRIDGRGRSSPRGGHGKAPAKKAYHQP